MFDSLRRTVDKRRAPLIAICHLKVTQIHGLSMKIPQYLLTIRIRNVYNTEYNLRMLVTQNSYLNLTHLYQ